MSHRRTKLTEKVIEAAAENILKGMPIKYAAEGAGIKERSFYTYREQGEKDIEEGKTDTLAARFSQTVRQADRDFIEINLGRITEATLPHGDRAGQWTAAAWLLERRYCRYFGKQKIELSGPGDGPIRLSVADSDDVMAALDRAGKVGAVNAASNGR